MRRCAAALRLCLGVLTCACNDIFALLIFLFQFHTLPALFSPTRRRFLPPLLFFPPPDPQQTWLVSARALAMDIERRHREGAQRHCSLARSLTRHVLLSLCLCPSPGWPPQKQGPAYEVEDDDHFDDQEEEEETTQGDSGRPQPSLRDRALYRAMTGIAYAAEYSVVAFKWGWVPFVATMGLSNLYCTSETPAFSIFRDMFKAGMEAQAQAAGQQ